MIPNSKRSLQLAEFARDEGRFEQVHAGLFRAYWSQHLNIGEAEVLVQVASAAGLDPDKSRQVLVDGRYEDRIALTTQSAYELGTGGVPAWMIDDRALIFGAQPHEVFDQSMSELGHEPQEK